MAESKTSQLVVLQGPQERTLLHMGWWSRADNRNFARPFCRHASILFVVAQKDDEGRISVKVAGDASLFARGQLCI